MLRAWLVVARRERRRLTVSHSPDRSGRGFFMRGPGWQMPHGRPLRRGADYAVDGTFHAGDRSSFGVERFAIIRAIIGPRGGAKSVEFQGPRAGAPTPIRSDDPRRPDRSRRLCTINPMSRIGWRFRVRTLLATLALLAF